MENIEKLLKQANDVLDKMMKQLGVLEDEKQQIIEQCKNATSDEMVLLEEKMKTSEENFQLLCENILALAEKVKTLKQRCC